MDKALRNTLRNTVTQCRKLLEEATGALLEGQFGIHGAGTVEDASDMGHLSEEDQRYRGDLLAHLEHIRAAGIKPREAVAQLVREIAFTHLNRLVAFKMMEARGLIREAVSRGIKSQGFLFYLAEHPDDERLWSGGEPERAYRHYLLWLGATFGEEIPALFDPLDPANRAFPPQKVLDQVLELLNGAELAGIWAEDEAIGWVYQYFTPKELREQARKESAAPRNSYELAFRNQFYTPRYVVEFLTDNTLGRTWYEMTRGETALTDRCRYLVRRPREVFLGNPHVSHDKAADWVRSALAGDFSSLPERPGFDEIGEFALLIDGYAVAPALGYGELAEFANKHIAAYEEQGTPFPGDSLELWLILFAYQRGYLRDGRYGTEEDDATLRAIRVVYDALRAALQNPPEDLSQEELLRQPVYIPLRAPKDPRDIKMLDPACGSMHFGLYAFDLFEVIYHEAWERRLFAAKDAGYRAEPAFLHETVRLDPSTDPVSNYSGKSVPFDDAYVVITRRGDAGDGVEADVPYIVASSQRFRVPFDYRVKLSAFDYQAALQSGLIDERAGERFVREVGCFQFAEERAVSREEAFAAFRREVPRLILEHNIHGIDIDPRACQIAALALWLRAQRTWQEQGLAPEDRPRITRAHVVCAESMPGDKALLEEYLLSVDTRLQPLVRTIWEEMQLAGEAGSLLKIEEEIAEALDVAKTEALFEGPPVQMTLYQPNLPPQQMVLDLRASDEERAFWARAEGALLDALHGYARRAANGQGLRRRLFAGDAEQGLAFIDLCRQRYDVVLMNPPFGAATARATQYLCSSSPGWGNDIYVAFAIRAQRLCSSKGFLGAITSRLAFYLSSFASWRTDILLAESRIHAFADLGYGVLDEALVEVAAWTLRKPCEPIHASVFLSLLSETDKQVPLGARVKCTTKYGERNVFAVRQETFTYLDGAPFCYWVSDSLRTRLSRLPTISEIGGDARVGLSTADDERFLRVAWEVAPSAVGPSKRWVHLAKGGEYTPFYDDIHLLVDWRGGESPMKECGAAIRNQSFYLRPGLTYSQRSTSAFNPKVLPASCIFSTGGHGVFAPSMQDLYAILGLLSSRVVALQIEMAVGSGDEAHSGSAARNYLNGMINRLRIPHFVGTGRDLIASYARKLVCLALRKANMDETTRCFERPMAGAHSGSSLKQCVESYVRELEDIDLEMIRVYTLLDEAVSRQFALTDSERGELDRETGAHLDHAETPTLEQVASDYMMDLPDLISSTCDSLGAARFITKKSFTGSRRLELIARHLQTSPCQVVRARRESGLVPSPQRLEVVQACASYTVGCVYGRWDARVARDDALCSSQTEPFSALPTCPPGMLVGPDGLPATPGSIVSEEWLRARPDANTLPPEGGVAHPTTRDEEYPLRVHWDGILVDDPDHPDDIVRRVREVLSLLWDERAEAIEGEACEILGVAELRDYFRKPTKGGFWLDHVQRYSKSRRKAPIYWLLQSEKRNYGLWLYYHRLDRDLLFKALVNYVEPKVRLEVARLAELRAEGESAGVAGRAAKELERRIDRQEAFVSELVDFRDQLRRAADLRLDPDLNDGVVLNIAPLWELVPWKVAKQYWDALEAGEYEWSSIGKQLREKGRVKG